MQLAAERNLLAAARAGDERAFERLVAPHRRALHAHCYRMLGSLHDADDALQETLLRAWRQLEGFAARGPLRAWLYRIATNVCLTAIARRRTRAGAAPGDGEDAPGAVEVPHLEPYPLDAVPDPEPPPDLRYEERESVELAFIAAVQVLPARQRAVLLLRDVLGWSAAETAEVLQTSVASANGLLRRARAALQAERAAGRLGRAHGPASSAAERRVILRYVEAWERVDIPGLAALLAEDALLTMPPEAVRIEGRDAVAEFFGTVPAEGRLDRITLVDATANGQPALAAYLDDPADDDPPRAYGVMVLSIEGERIAAITGFPDPALFPRFGLPEAL